MLNKQGPGKIDWCDYSFNPISGCLHDCKYCYLKRLAIRYGKDMMKPKFHEDRLDDLNRKKLPPGTKIFVGSSGDMFGDWLSWERINRVIEETRKHPDIIFQFLTKNPKAYKEFKFPKNCWLGTTIESAEEKQVDRFDDFLDAVQNNSECVWFVSFEPLLGPNVERFLAPLDWVIVGADSTPGAQRPPYKWCDAIIDNCKTFNVPVWVKDNYGYKNKIKEFPIKNLKEVERNVEIKTESLLDLMNFTE